MSNYYIFESQRLGFRRWTAMDQTPFAQMNADNEVMKFFPNKLSRDASDAFLRKIDLEHDQKGYGLWAVDVKESNSFIGFIGFHEATFEADFTPCIEIGWRLCKESWNNGYATEGAKACVDYAFNHLHIDTIYSFTAVINISSINVMEKIGLNKVTTFEHPNLVKGHPLRPHVLYRIDK